MSQGVSVSCGRGSGCQCFSVVFPVCLVFVFTLVFTHTDKYSMC